VATHIIGDVHGCYRELCELLERLGPGSEDRIVFVGDLVVRGPDNPSVVRLVADGALANVTVVLGNNEAKLRPVLAGDPRYATPVVLAAIEQLRSAGMLEETLALFDTFPLYVDLGSHAVTHAGVRPGRPLAEQSREDLLQIKTLDGTPDGPLWWEQYYGPEVIVFGHHVVKTPRFLPHAVAIDTGCVYGGHLSAFTIETGRITSVRAADVYYQNPTKAFLLET
jgi:serine/threonine protein phosphatase 1